MVRRRRTSKLPHTSVRDRLLGGYSPLRRSWRRYRPLWLWERSATGRASASLIRRHGLEVGHGPFRGMRYPHEAVGRANTLAVKLLGSYESELSHVMAETITAGFPKIVNIGAGEGFYAVGLALKSPGSTVHAFETDAGERRLCRRIAEHNGVFDRVRVEGSCDVGRLSELGAEIGDTRTFVLCDCEGCELALLRPDRVPLLARATLLVELHPIFDSRIPAVIVDRFCASHDITLIHGTPPSTPPELEEMIEAANASFLLSEGRVGADPEWAYLTPCDGA